MPVLVRPRHKNPLPVSPGGRRPARDEQNRGGRYVTSRLPRGRPDSLALDASFRAAARWGRLRLQPQDIREKVRRRPAQSTICILLDASGSMGVQRRMEFTKGLVASLLRDGRHRRDRLALLAFREAECSRIYGPGRSLEVALAALAALPVGGKTPLGHGIGRALEFLLSERRRLPGARPVLIVVSDGNGNIAVGGDDPYCEALFQATQVAVAGVKAVFIDTETDACAFGYGRQVARSMRGDYLVLEAARRRGFLELDV